jgi:hypothetical protein
MTRLAAILVVATACSSRGRQSQPAPPAISPDGDTVAVVPVTPAPDRPLVSWGGTSHFGSDSFTIRADGTLRKELTRPGQPVEVETGTATAAELGALQDALEAAGCCALASQREIGVPDEGHTTLALAFPDLACVVSLWDNEWHELPAAARCGEVLEPLRSRPR